jgi:hypothetical protein
MEDLNKELENAPKLSQLQGKFGNPDAPDGYFENLEGSVFERIKQNGDLRAPSQMPLTARKGGRWRWMIAAAALAGIALSGWWLYQNQKAAAPMAAVHELSADDAEAYVLENLDSYEPTELVADMTELPTLMEEENVSEPKAQPAEKGTSTQPTELEPDLLDELTDEDLEKLL